LGTPIADKLRPKSPRAAAVYEVACWIAGGAAVALGARFAVDVPSSPVPVTGQSLAVLLAGGVLGASRGALAMTLYAVAGAAGLPLFVGGKSGIDHVTGPTGGYILGFIAAAAMVGALVERGWDESFVKALAAAVLGTCVMFAIGVWWLSSSVGGDDALAQGLQPHLVGAALKAFVAAAVLWVMHRLAH